MDDELDPAREVTRVPTDADLVSLARELNRLGVSYVVVGGFAINRLGFVRATEDIDLLIARDRANQLLVKQALEILPDRAIRELGDEDIAQWVVVRVNDDITIDLMTEACGVRFEDAGGGIEIEEIDGVPIPFAGAELMLEMKRPGRTGSGRCALRGPSTASDRFQAGDGHVCGTVIFRSRGVGGATCNSLTLSDRQRAKSPLLSDLPWLRSPSCPPRSFARCLRRVLLSGPSSTPCRHWCSLSTNGWWSMTPTLRRRARLALTRSCC
jgi:hypothetical protein